MTDYAGAVQPVEHLHPFQFTGRGGEYFRIWIVNLLLSVVTLGIYSAWAKVRREQYFHRHYQIAGSSLDYHGDPKSILRGRAIVVGVLIGTNFIANMNPSLNIVVSIAFSILTPWVICQAMRFRAHNTSWRNMRMGFVGRPGGVVKVLYFYGLAIPFSLGLAFPWWKQRYQRYLASNLRFGGEPFSANPRTSDYYKAYGVLALFMAAIVLVFFWALPSAITSAIVMKARPDPIKMVIGFAVLFVFVALLYFFSATYLRARLGNALWNTVSIGENRFRSTLRARNLLWLVVSNTIATILTLGFFAPFAKVRLARYRAETLALVSAGDLEEFVREQAERIQALGDEAAEFFDVDLGF